MQWSLQEKEKEREEEIERDGRKNYEYNNLSDTSSSQCHCKAKANAKAAANIFRPSYYVIEEKEMKKKMKRCVSCNNTERAPLAINQMQYLSARTAWDDTKNGYHTCLMSCLITRVLERSPPLPMLFFLFFNWRACISFVCVCLFKLPAAFARELRINFSPCSFLCNH